MSVSAILFFFCLALKGVLCEEQASSQQAQKQEPKYVGIFFDIQVPIENYYFIKGVIAVFGNKFGPQPQNEQEKETIIWDQLLLSYEAFRRGITVNQEEVDQEITKILQTDKVDFDWKNNKEAYERWVKEKVNVSTALFENQLRYLLQLQKLREQVMESIEPQVTEKEAYQEFLNEHNSLSVELVQFDEKKDADRFYKNAKANPKLWDEEKNKRPNDFKRPGFIALEFLIDIWRFSKDAVYKMMKMKAGEVHPAAPIYKGWGVFRVLDKRPANTAEFKRFKDSYYGQIRTRKKYDGLSEWFESLKKQANITIYKEGRENG